MLRIAVLPIVVLCVTANCTLRADDFESLAQKAAAALEHDPQQSANLYRQALSMRPEWAEGWFYLGVNYYGLRQFGQAEESFRRARALAPENGNVWAFLGLAEAEGGKRSQALADIRKGETLGLGDNTGFEPAVRNRAALELLSERNFSAAVEQLRPLTIAGVRSANTIDTLGVAVLERHYLPSAMPDRDRALVNAAGEAAFALYGDREAEARRLLTQLTTAYPDQPGVHYLYALYLLTREPERARAELERELTLSPERVDVRLQLAILDIKTGQAQLALKLASAALQLEPHNLLAHAVAGRAFLDTGRYADAIRELEAASQIAPDNPQMHLYLAQAFRHTGQEEKARREQAEFARLRSSQQQAEASFDLK